VPELVDGTVEIVNIAREPGHRTKIAVISHDPNVDPKGACVGARGSRVRQVVNELRGEKVDVVQWRDDVAQFIAEALGPAKVKEVHIDEEEKTADVVVSEHQLSLAIGKEGQNARLAARLSGYKVDIRSDSEGPRQRRSRRLRPKSKRRRPSRRTEAEALRRRSPAAEETGAESVGEEPADADQPQPRMKPWLPRSPPTKYWLETTKMPSTTPRADESE
jgi:transcription termination/antitermination protein NusA